MRLRSHRLPGFQALRDDYGDVESNFHRIRNPNVFERKLWEKWLRYRGYTWLPDTVRELKSIAGKVSAGVVMNHTALDMIKHEELNWKRKFKEYNKERKRILGPKSKTFDYVPSGFLRGMVYPTYGVDAKAYTRAVGGVRGKLTPNQRAEWDNKALAVVMKGSRRTPGVVMWNDD